MRIRRPSRNTSSASWGFPRACPAFLGVVVGLCLSVAPGGDAAFAEVTVTGLRVRVRR